MKNRIINSKLVGLHANNCLDNANQLTILRIKTGTFVIHFVAKIDQKLSSLAKRSEYKLNRKSNEECPILRFL
jgi:hypothetical protein